MSSDGYRILGPIPVSDFTNSAAAFLLQRFLRCGGVDRGQLVDNSYQYLSGERSENFEWDDVDE